MIICIDCKREHKTRAAFDEHVCEAHDPIPTDEVIRRFLSEANTQFVSRTAKIVNQ